MVVGITHVGVRVTDLEKSLEFYLRIPDVQEAFRLYWDDGSLMMVWLKVAPRQFLELFPGGSKGAPAASGYFHVCLQTDDIHGLYDELLKRGITPRGRPEKHEDDHSWQFWIDDPEGNAIEFQEFTADSLELK